MVRSVRFLRPLSFVRPLKPLRPLRALRSLIMLAWLICSTSQQTIRLTEQTTGTYATTYVVEVCCMRSNTEL